MTRLRFRIITDIQEAKNIWQDISPHKVIDDEWNLRFNFFKWYSHTLHFIVGYDDKTPVGILPLQKNNGKTVKPAFVTEEGEFLEFFGSDDTDNNVVLLLPEYEGYEEQFFAQITLPTYLAPLARPYMFRGITAQEYTQLYHLDLSMCHTYDDYLTMYWNGSSGSQLKKHIRKIYRENHIQVMHGHIQDLETMYVLNEQRFKNQSSLIDPIRQKILFDLADDFKNELITLRVNGNIEAVSLGLHYRDAYVGLNAGTNREFRDIGKLSVLLRIEHAIALGCKIYDSGKGSYGWKEKFGFKGIPQYLLVIKP